jgi:hypothetical protein
VAPTERPRRQRLPTTPRAHGSTGCKMGSPSHRFTPILGGARRVPPDVCGTS